MVYSSDGKATYQRAGDLTLAAGEVIAWQSMAGTPPLPADKRITGQAYRLDISGVDRGGRHRPVQFEAIPGAAKSVGAANASGRKYAVRSLLRRRGLAAAQHVHRCPDIRQPTPC
ncbi:MAG: hypothetical protein R2838_00190 [Caldilineaceae bacterium]